MCSAVDRVDVVGERVDLFVVAVVVLNGDLKREILRLLLKVDRLIVKRGLVLIQVLDELRDSTFVIELVRTLRLFAFVFDRDANAFV